MSTRTALQVNGAVGVASSVVAAAVTWRLLTRPEQVVSAFVDSGYRGIFLVVGEQLAAWLHALLRFL
jgi:hypothetical protein